MNSPVIDIRDFGAVGDGRADDTSAFHRAANHAGSLVRGNYRTPPRIVVPNAGDRYVISDQVIIPTGVELICDGVISVDASESATMPTGWLRIGDLDANVWHLDRQLSYKISLVRERISNWGRYDVGVYFAAHAGAALQQDTITGFGIGMYYSSAYGRNLLGEFRNCGIGLLIDDNVLFANASNFWGGYFACNGGVNASQDRYGVYIRSSVNGGNSLLFNGQSFELQSRLPNGAKSIAVHLDGTDKNLQNYNFLHQRVEGVDISFQTEGNVSYCNWQPSLTGIGLPAPAKDLDGRGKGNYVLPSFGAHLSTVFDSGPLVGSFYEVSEKHKGFRNMVTLVNAGPAPKPSVVRTQMWAGWASDSGATLSGGISGVFVDTRRFKDFVVEFDLDHQQQFGTVYAIGYRDFEGTETYDAIKSLSGQGVYQPRVYGGVYAWGSIDRCTSFTVAQDCPLVFVGIGGGMYKSWKILGIDGPATVVTQRCEPYHTQQPTSGNWKEGDFVRDSTGKTYGWVYTPQGWKTIGFKE